MSSSSTTLVDALFVNAQKRRTSPHPELVRVLARCDVLLPTPERRGPAPGALTRWSRRPITFVRMSAVAALDTALTHGFDGVVFDIAGPAHVRLDRPMIHVVLNAAK
jgi:hypothetical protein